MLSPIEKYYLEKEEPIKSCLQFLRQHILDLNPNITEAWKYGMPFFCYNGKMMCYLWIHKKYGQPYLGIVEGAKINHPDLLVEKRARMKVLLVDPTKNILVRKLNRILEEMMALYR
ncbi:MAG: DUF1801 domain-containing protein [Bacteroidetes bacterium]|nr:DUF1801 domain-containing protein [Bacteroidota bacterium]